MSSNNQERSLAARLRALVLLSVAVMPLAAKAESRTVTVPGTATGGFGVCPDGALSGFKPFIVALKVTHPGTITLANVSGAVNYGGPGGPVPANGGDFIPTRTSWALPLDEAAGITPASFPKQNVAHMAALIAAFVPASRVGLPGFQPVDGTKAIAAAGILPSELFFVGEYHVIEVSEPGTIYLGVNDNCAADNSGEFVVTVTSP
jgi:hypothetical protein